MCAVTADPCPVRVALAFVAAINARQPDRIAEHMTDDHEFIDKEGNRLCGRDAVRKAWLGYYSMFPDYSVHIDHTVVRHEMVVLVGRSSGRLSQHARATLRRPDGSAPEDGDFQGPALWTARIIGELVSQWQVYPDTPTVRHRLLPGPG